MSLKASQNYIKLNLTVSYKGVSKLYNPIIEAKDDNTPPNQMTITNIMVQDATPPNQMTITSVI